MRVPLPPPPRVYRRTFGRKRGNSGRGRGPDLGRIGAAVCRRLGAAIGNGIDDDGIGAPCNPPERRDKDPDSKPLGPGSPGSGRGQTARHSENTRRRNRQTCSSGSTSARSKRLHGRDRHPTERRTYNHDKHLDESTATAVKPVVPGIPKWVPKWSVDVYGPAYLGWPHPSPSRTPCPVPRRSPVPKSRYRPFVTSSWSVLTNYPRQTAPKLGLVCLGASRNPIPRLAPISTIY